MADERGILMIVGWCCCDSWQHWKHWGPEQHQVAVASTRDQAKRLRIHPSMLAFWYSSDDVPPADVEKEYIDALMNLSLWPNPILASASDRTSKVSGPTGVKMSGPYAWVPPNYWLEDTNAWGGAYGFLTEGGPGEAPLTYESQVATLSPSSLWPADYEWDYHCGSQHGLYFFDLFAVL
jgi:exo-1,4-beta-D-glucosaminidase